MVITVPWEQVAVGLVLPILSWQAPFWTMVLAIFGTTISPYLFFWQASQEVEETEAAVGRAPLVEKPRQGPDAINRIRFDTIVGMTLSNLVALAIIVTSAATLNANGITDLETASQAAQALRPIAGPLAFTVFTLGIVGTGLLAVPVLAGSAAYALAEARKWPLGLARPPNKAKAFYATIAVATLGGSLINFAPINPIKALVFSAVVNGVVAVPIMAVMMHMTANPKIMGKFTVRGGLRIMGWAATIMMAAAALGLMITSLYN